MSKICTLVFVLLLAFSGLLVAESTYAQYIAKPSIPEFTLSVTDQSYDVQTKTTTTTDPYDGQIKTTTTPGYHVKNGSVTLAIRNQPFTSYYNPDGFPVKLYYHIRVKGHYDADWYHRPYNYEGGQIYFEAINDTYTVVQFNYQQNSFEDNGYFNSFFVYPKDGKIDFGVEAFIGYCDVTNIDPTSLVVRPDDLVYAYYGQTSGWSPTQTISIGNAPTSTSSTPESTSTQTPTPTPIQTSKPTTAVPSINENQPQANDSISLYEPLPTFLSLVFIFTAVILVLSALLLRRQRKTTNIIP